MAALPDFAARVQWFVENLPLGQVVQHIESPAHAGWRMLSIVDEAKLRRLLGAMLDPDEFLSDHGLRGLSRRHLRQPLTIEVGGVTDTLDYEPGESRTGLFGGNSNWRGPVWFPINFLLIETLRVYHRFLGDDFTVEFPTGDGDQLTLAEVADELADRLIGIFRKGPDGRRPVLGSYRLPAGRPGLARPHPVPRVLPRRHRRRARRLAPDRLDRPGGEPDHRPGAGVRRRTLPALAAACIAATACGGHTATKQDVIARANGICINTLRAVRSVPPPAGGAGSPAALAAYLQKVVPIVQKEASDTQALPRPAQDRAVLDRYVAAVTASASQYRALADGGQERRYGGGVAGPGGAASKPGAGSRRPVRTDPMQHLGGDRSVVNGRFCRRLANLCIA